jgi:hypothetical protein
VSGRIVTILLVLLLPTVVSRAGPYTEPGVNAYINSDYTRANPQQDPNAIINPLFRGWATGCTNYIPSDDEWTSDWDNPEKAFGPATGSNFDVVSLGDLDPNEIRDGILPGSITLTFAHPNDPNDLTNPEYAIRNGGGYDFVVFENAFASLHTTPGGSITGQMIAELAYVEVSSDGINFVRFPSVSLTPDSVGPYGTIEISDVYNLAGKHPNSYSICTGTPFNLNDISNHQLVVDGTVDINNIHYVRLVDIPGSGDFYDTANDYIDPDTFPDWDYYYAGHPVYDAWVTWGSGGFDLEAIGVLEEQQYSADINLDGIVNMQDFVMFSHSWQSHFGSANWSPRCDLPESRDFVVDVLDLVAFTEQWFGREQWRKN